MRLITSSRASRSRGGDDSSTSGISTAAPECPYIEYEYLCSRPANDSMIIMAVAAALSSLRSHPLKLLIEPDKSIQNRSRFGCCCTRPNSGSLLPRRLNTFRSPRAPSTLLTTGRG